MDKKMYEKFAGPDAPCQASALMRFVVLWLRVIKKKGGLYE